ncbi:MAG: hypothetical protein HYR66_01415 [Sphingobacteriales bacterium]|nr:hypothetical protein [Sphingobacteriales bacterium]MBI3720145.1 hypothetical protein [Sphingobacteriales bacterium]
MKKILLLMLIYYCSDATHAQSSKTELYDLIKKLVSDSTGEPGVGEWGVGEPKKLPVKWKEDRVIMSDDTSINFYRLGTADIIIKGKSFAQNSQPVKWNIMLKGPRMGYTSFSIISSPSNEMLPKFTIDSVFGKKPFTSKLIKSCENKTIAGYYYYEIKIPKKEIVYIKLSWLSLNGNTAMRIDCYNDYSKYAAKLDCPK